MDWGFFFFGELQIASMSNGNGVRLDILSFKKLFFQGKKGASQPLTFVKRRELKASELN